ncbi:IS66 family transposase [Paraburkholderia caledonica]|uniref:IS66 family transposase n=1 Tax=Paraburkholderia caledonica TaxID=134536 RepID=UPI0038B73F94
MPGSNVSLITCCLNACAYVRWGCVRPAAFDMADCLRQAERAHHASKYSALGNGRAESLTNQWQALIYYCDDGVVEIDDNIVENALRTVSLGRKNFSIYGRRHRRRAGCGNVPPVGT